MNRRLEGIWLLAALFAGWGLIGLRGATESGAFARFPRLAISILLLVTAYGLFKRRPWTLQAYAIWAGLALVAGLAGEIVAGTHLLVVVVAGLLIGAVYAAMGLYIRANLPGEVER